jgi:hypothetical protein
MFEGRSRRAASEADLNSVVDGRGQVSAPPADAHALGAA